MENSSKKRLTVILAVLIILAITAAGTLAYLTASQAGDKAVVNTFMAAGGGNLTDPDAPDPGFAFDVNKGFYLVESKAKYDGGQYSLEAAKTLTNQYDKVVPSMEIPKDPKLTVDLADGAEAYIFVKVTDTTNSIFTYAINSEWTKVAGTDNVYCYKNDIVSTDLTEVSILEGDKIEATDFAGGISDLGSLKFEAYMCQAGGFQDAAEAWNTAF